MKRRTILERAGLLGLAGSPIVSGCLDTVTSAGDGDGYQWRYDVGGEIDAVSQGAVFVRERTAGDLPGGESPDSGPAADGEIVALDADTGDQRWTYGGAGGMDSDTDLTISDGVYFGYCTDDDCTDLTALELDGEERWTRDVDPGHHRPLVVDGVVYVANDAGPVRALDAATGETRWDRDLGEGESHPWRIADVGDVVSVETNAALVALDRETGDTRWRYEPAGDQVVTGAVIADGVAYVVTFDRVAAVAEGDEGWRREFEEVEGSPEVEGIASGRLFLLAERDRTADGRREFRLDAIDLATGDRDWTLGPIEHPNPEYRPRVALHDEVAYVGTDRLRALDAATGDERWSESLDSGSIRSVSVAEEDVSEDHAVFVHGDGNRLASFAPDGERTWEGSVPGEIGNYLVGDSVFVATDEGIYALDRRDDP
ncbi:PQQ-binding-like beta-propeller repeat protein [Salinilacihabitans rarus]|uniref:outer membrane protein assembly factor BamB family protein n=1 Tax=Salinilacihabitans rarus TaxID=2961596 RepID=UPI0020C9189A|nr:PQQ-binding-like beta-propeller repeat protein [Salinilacihabitans rarus]